MTSIITRPSNPGANPLDWLETESAATRSFGTAPYIDGRLEVRVPYAVDEPKATRVAIEHDGS